MWYIVWYQVSPRAKGYATGMPFVALFDLTLVDRLECMRSSMDDTNLQLLETFALSVAQVRMGFRVQGFKV
jgi:hypothetical protein